MDHEQREELEDICKEGGSTMARVDYSADDLKMLGKGSIVTTPDEWHVAIKLTARQWTVSGYTHMIPDYKMFQVSNDWSNVRTILK